MAEITDDFGRVNNFQDVAFDTIKKILSATVGEAVKFSKENQEQTQKSQDQIANAERELKESVSAFDRTIKDQIDSYEKLVKEIKEFNENLTSQRKESAKQNDFKAIQQEQLKVLNLILDNQRKAQNAKIASFTASTPMIAKSKTAPAFNDQSVNETVIRKAFKRPKKSKQTIEVVELINNIFGKLDKKDSVLAGLQPGEYVLRRNAAREIGKENLERLNRADKLPKFSKGGVVKGFVGGGGNVPPPARGTRTILGAIRTRLGIDPQVVVTPQAQQHYSELGSELAEYASYSFRFKWRKNVAAWLTSVSALMLGGQADFFKVLFGGSVTDVTDFRRQVRGLAFELEGIGSSTVDLQNNFGDMGKSINETGKSLDAVFKSYLQNAKKGFKSQKDGLKSIKSGLYLSTMIGSQTESTAELFADWYRTLNLSADQMGRLARDSRFLAMSTGVTGDELIGAMKASENILKNLKNQGNLTSATAKNVIEMMAQAKKLGIEEQAGKVMGALSGTNSLLSADDKTKTFVLAMTSRISSEATKAAINGTFMQDKSNLGKFANQMNSLIRQLTGGRAKGVQDIDKLDAQSRMRLSIQLQGITGMEIDEFKRTQEIFESSSKGLGDKLKDLEKQIEKRTATESEKLKATQQKQLLLLNASSGFLSSLSDAANREENLNMADAVQDAMSKLSADEKRDLDQLITRLDASTMSQLAAFGGDEKKFLAAGLLSAQKLKEAAKSQNLSVKDFGPELIDAMQRGDMARLRSVSEELNQASQRLDIEMKMATDPITKLAFTLNQYNETIRTYMSKFVGAIMDLLGPMNLLAVQIGMLAAGLYVTFGKDLLNRLGFDGLFKLSDFFGRKKPVNPFAGMGGHMGSVAQRTTTRTTESSFQRIVKAWRKILIYVDKGLLRMGKKISDFFSKGKFLPRTFRNAYAQSRGLGRFAGPPRGVLFSLGRAFIAQFIAFFQGAFKLLVKPVFGAFEWLFKSIASKIPTNAKFIERSGDLISTGFRGITTGISAGVARIIASLSQLRSWLSTPLAPGAGRRAIGGITTWITNIPSRINAGLRVIGNILEGGVIGLFKGIGRVIRGGFNVLRAPLKAARAIPGVNLVVAVVDGLIGAVSGFMSTSETFKEAIADSALGYGEATTGMYAASTAGGALAGILDGLTFGILSLVGLRKPLEEFLSFLIFGIIDSLYEFGKGIYDAFDVSWLTNQFSELGAMIKDTVNSIFGTDFKSMGEMFAGLMKTLKPFFYMLGKVVGFLASAIVNVIGGALVGILKTIVVIIKGISSLVNGLMWMFSDDFTWQKLFDGIYNNMKWVWNGVVTWVSGLGATLYEGFTKALKDVWNWFTSWSKDSRTDEQKAAYDQLQKLYNQKNALGPAERRWYEISTQRADKAKRELPAIQSEITRLEQIAVAPGVLYGSASKTVAETKGTVVPQPPPPPNTTSLETRRSNVVGQTDFSADHLVSTQNEMLDQGDTSLKQGRITAEAAEQQMTPGSIYVHDIHAESLLVEILKTLKKIAGEEFDASAIEEYIRTREIIAKDPEKGAEKALKASAIKKQIKTLEAEKDSFWWWLPWKRSVEEIQKEMEKKSEELSLLTPGRIPIPKTNLPTFGAPAQTASIVGEEDFYPDRLVSTQAHMIDQGDLSLKQGEIMAKTLKMGQQVGSMYVHDVHCETLLYMILEQLKGNNPDANAYKSTMATLRDNPETGMQKIMEEATKSAVTVTPAPAETKPVPPPATTPKPAETKPVPPPATTPAITTPAVVPALELEITSNRALEEAHSEIIKNKADIRSAEMELKKATDETTKKNISSRIAEHNKALEVAYKSQTEAIHDIAKEAEKSGYEIQETLDEQTGLVRVAKRKKVDARTIDVGGEQVTTRYQDNETDDLLRRAWEGEVRMKQQGGAGTDLGFEEWKKQYHKTRSTGLLEERSQLASETMPTWTMSDQTYEKWQENMTKKMLKEQQDNLYALTEDQAIAQGMARGDYPVFADKSEAERRNFIPFREHYDIDGLLKSREQILEPKVSTDGKGGMKVTESTRLEDALARESLELDRLKREKASLGPERRTWGEFLTFQDKTRAEKAQAELPRIQRQIDKIEKRRSTEGYLVGNKPGKLAEDMIPELQREGFYVDWEQENASRLPGTSTWLPEGWREGKINPKSTTPDHYQGPDSSGLHYRLNKENLPGPVMPDGTPIQPTVPLEPTVDPAILEKQAQDTAISAEASKQAMEPGSIYVHDIHAEKILKSALKQAGLAEKADALEKANQKVDTVQNIANSLIDQPAHSQQIFENAMIKARENAEKFSTRIPVDKSAYEPTIEQPVNPEFLKKVNELQKEIMDSGLDYSLPPSVSSSLDTTQLEEKASSALDSITLARSTPVGQHAVPALRAEDDGQVGGVQPVHLRDITESILREKASADSGNRKIQSDELTRIEEVANEQVAELVEIKEGIREMVSLLRPRGSSLAGISESEGPGKTRDPRRPLHAAQFGKMKYGKPGGNANRALINNGES